MVNITESFTKLYGRPPNETELASMWQMKREQEGFRKQQIQEKAKEPNPKRLREPKTPTSVSISKEKFPYRASRDAKCINRMLLIQMTVKDIAYCLGHSENFVMSQIEKWQLPREPEK
jgi:hypothetical protein